MKKETRKKVISWVNQGLIFIGLFVLITWWQQKDMLSTANDNLSPSFSLVSVEGEVFEFASHQQTKTTLIYFFAPWCSVCHASIDNIEAIRRGSPNEINFYAVALDWKSKEEVEEFLSEHDLKLPVLLGTQKTQDDFKIKGFPSYYVIDEKGILQSRDFGYTTELGMRVRLGLASL